jgi:Ca2+-binding EF-hand superfamily protein
LEIFAWTADVATREHKASVRANGRSSAVYLNELRGISFYKCLERLALLHYGKARCLDYAAQMAEYNTELKQASLLVVSAWVSWWVFKRTKTVQGHPWPWEHAWKKCPNAYAWAVDSVLDLRLRSLRTLLQEIDKRKPELADVELKSRETETSKSYKTRKHAKAVKRNRKELRALFKILDLDGDGTLDEEEFRHAMARLGAADGAELDSVLGTLVAGNEEIDEDMFVEALAVFADAARKDPNHWIWKLQIPDDVAQGQAVSALTRGSDKIFQDRKKVVQLSELKTVFSSIDADGDGTLDEDEIRQAMGKLSAVEASQFESQLGELVTGDIPITEEVFVDALSAAADAARNDTNHWVWRLALDEDDLDEELDEFEDDLDDLDAEYLPQVAE